MQGTRRTMRLVGALALLALATGTLPGTVAGQEIDCDAPELGAIGARLAVAEAAALTGDRDTMLAIVDEARTALDAIVEACPGGVIASIPPVELSGSLDLRTFSFRYPDALLPLESDLLRSVNSDEDRNAEAITLGDSAETGELVSSALDEPLPATARAISLAVGTPDGVLGSIGAFGRNESAPATPLLALEALAGRFTEQSEGGPVRVVPGAVTALTFADGDAGAAFDVPINDEDGLELVATRFLLRELEPGTWALVVGASPAEALDELADQALAVLDSIVLTPGE